jgi:ligand-binding sensor protein
VVYFSTSDWTMEDLAGLSIQPVGDLLTTKQLRDLPICNYPPDRVCGPSWTSLPRLWGVGAAITAAEGVSLTAISHPGPFFQMVPGIERRRQRCLDSRSEPRAAALALPPSRPPTCDAGQNYLSAPIQVQGKVVAAIHAGQFLPATSEPLADRQGPLAELAAAMGLEAGDLAQALAAVPRLDRLRLQQVSDLLYRVARAGRDGRRAVAPVRSAAAHRRDF